ncbi:hypothetical protein L226DRAFT_255795 [Lentinus tigrinus ALCF2SS1-7]|uniref:Uncharacterized protein n=1 Tax=Lentinus tigrinus ALCF2SS1-6 TaxID=1328759 RepID=A0A5C2RRD6_9APHY|nr:hypothetical protein L227DRAFT_381487 [Lentinus tigrinus ALCF2SS1-6]RPD79671.1 hypothetical protein L226DRAFT_255795 [Lentinus tigrinus ALCF2SS1-7]
MMATIGSIFVYGQGVLRFRILDTGAEERECGPRVSRCLVIVAAASGATHPGLSLTRRSLRVSVRGLTMILLPGSSEIGTAAVSPLFQSSLPLLVHRKLPSTHRRVWTGSTRTVSHRACADTLFQ